MAKKHLSLDFNDWPSVDCRAWIAAQQTGSLFETRGLGAHWAKATRRNVSQCYGQWLHFLQTHSWLDPLEAPCERATKARLIDYFDELNRRVCSVSIASNLRNLSEALRVMDPDGDRSAVQGAVAYAQSLAEPSRDERPKIVGPSELYYAGIARMQRLQEAALMKPRKAVEYAEGLMMGIAASKPLRRRNLTHMVIGSNLRQGADGNFVLHYASSETKTRREIEADLPASLSPFVEAWLNRIRPVLAGCRPSLAMWLNKHGDDMSEGTLYLHFRAATMEELGVDLNPHLVRKIVTTGIAVSAPEAIEIAQHCLDHTSDHMRRQAYDLSNKLSASRRHIDMLEQRRAQALKRLKRRDRSG